MSNKLLEIFKEEISEQVRKQARQYSLPIMMHLSVIAILMGAKNRKHQVKYIYPFLGICKILI